MIKLYEITENDTMAIECPYHEEFLKEFKALVPPQDRDPKQGMGWDKGDKLWYIPLDYNEAVEELLAKHFPGMKIEWEYVE